MSSQYKVMSFVTLAQNQEAKPHIYYSDYFYHLFIFIEMVNYETYLTEVKSLVSLM